MCKKGIIDKAIQRINAKTAQQNDPLYLAYCVEHLLNQLPK